MFLFFVWVANICLVLHGWPTPVRFCFYVFKWVANICWVVIDLFLYMHTSIILIGSPTYDFLRVGRQHLHVFFGGGDGWVAKGCPFLSVRFGRRHLSSFSRFCFRVCRRHLSVFVVFCHVGGHHLSGFYYSPFFVFPRADRRCARQTDRRGAGRPAVGVHVRTDAIGRSRHDARTVPHVPPLTRAPVPFHRSFLFPLLSFCYFPVFQYCCSVFL